MSKLLSIIAGCFVVAAGVLLLHHSHLVTGGTAGLSLSLAYLLEQPFSVVFFLINIPFYILSVLRMGWNFTLSTLFAITVLSFFTGLDRWLPWFSIPPLFGAVVGGVLIGFGVSMIFLNGSSLGGANILSLFFQKRFGWDPGKTNFCFDFVVVLSGFFTVGLINGLYSILSVFILSAIISRFKHKIAEKNLSRPQTA